MRGFYISLTKEEKWALTELAEKNNRDPRQQAAYFIRKGLECMGLIDSLPELDKERLRDLLQ